MMNVLKIILIVLCLITIFFLTLILNYLILLQSNKEDAGLGALTGQTDSNLFSEKKEQGAELYLSRMTTVCVGAIIILSLIINVYK